jgi:hypothetical protein
VLDYLLKWDLMLMYLLELTTKKENKDS